MERKDEQSLKARRRRWVLPIALGIAFAGWSCSAPAKNKKHDDLFDPDGAEIPPAEDVVNTAGGGSVGLRMYKVTAPKDDMGDTYTTDMAIWYPTTDKEAPYTYEYFKNKVKSHVCVDGAVAKGAHPVIVHSHGAGGGGYLSVYLCEILARKGYIVAAVDHSDDYQAVRMDPDATAKGRTGNVLKDGFALAMFTKKIGDYYAKNQTDLARKTLSYRPYQVRAMIDKLEALNAEADSPFRGRIDESKIAMFGHSLGGWTALMIAGVEPKYADPRVKAVIAMSAPSRENVYTPEELGRIRVPLMIQFGEKEVAMRSNDRTNLYNNFRCPRYMVSIADGTHGSFTGGLKKEYGSVDLYTKKDKSRAAVARYVLAFFDYYLKDDKTAAKQLSLRGDHIAGYIRNVPGATK